MYSKFRKTEQVVASNLDPEDGVQADWGMLNAVLSSKLAS